MRQVVESAFRVVYEPGALGLATYLANQFHLTGHARAPISGEEFSWDAARDKGENLVLVGGDSDAAQRALNETAVPLGLRRDGVSVGDCYFSGDLGVASLLPLRDGRLALLLAATSAELCGNQPVRRVQPIIFTKSFLGDDATALAPSSGEEPSSPRHRAGIASMAWRSTRRFRTNAP
jgi:hypothetical protein